MLTDRSYLVGVVGSAVLTAPRDAVDEIPVNVLRPSGRVPTIKRSRGNGISPLACRGRRLAAALRRPSPGSSLRNHGSSSVEPDRQDDGDTGREHSGRQIPRELGLITPRAEIAPSDDVGRCHQATKPQSYVSGPARRKSSYPSCRCTSLGSRPETAGAPTPANEHDAKRDRCENGSGGAQAVEAPNGRLLPRTLDLRPSLCRATRFDARERRVPAGPTAVGGAVRSKPASEFRPTREGVVVPHDSPCGFVRPRADENPRFEGRDSQHDDRRKN